MSGFTYQPQSITAITLSTFIFPSAFLETFTASPTMLLKHSVMATPHPEFFSFDFQFDNSSSFANTVWYLSPPSPIRWFFLNSSGSLPASCASSSIKLSYANPFVEEYTERHHMTGIG